MKPFRHKYGGWIKWICSGKRPLKWDTGPTIVQIMSWSLIVNKISVTSHWEYLPSPQVSRLIWFVCRLCSWSDVNWLMSAFRTCGHRGCCSSHLFSFLSLVCWASWVQLQINPTFMSTILPLWYWQFLVRPSPSGLSDLWRDDAHCLVWLCAGGPHHCWGKASRRSWSSQMFTKLLLLILRTTSLKDLKGLCSS